MADTAAIEEAIAFRALEVANQLGEDLVQRIRAAAPHASGALAESVSSGLAEIQGESVSVRLEATAEYALYQDEGTGPIVGNPWLVFEGSDGETVFLKAPRGTSGVPATHFWTDTIDEFRSEFGV